MSKDQDKQSNNRWLWWITPIGFLIPVVAAASYAIYFRGYEAGGPTEWGTFGDFIGGISNPLLSFLTIVLLLYSLRLQAKELKESTSAVKQSAAELNLTRRIYENQEILQIRENLRPQISDELKRRITRCKKILGRTIIPGLSFSDIVDAKGDVSIAVSEKRPMRSGSDIPQATRIFAEKSHIYKIAVGSVVDCLCSMIELSDTDVVIHPEIATTEGLIRQLFRAQIITYQEAEDCYYSRIEAALFDRRREGAFPPLHSTGLNLLAEIEFQRKSQQASQ